VSRDTVRVTAGTGCELHLDGSVIFDSSEVAFECYCLDIDGVDITQHITANI
jgi:hypothetical protein